MLVTNVSLRARRTIAVEIIEVAGAAEDVPGVVGFAMFVDEPAAATDALIAFTGEILNETASATATVTAGLLLSVLVDEPAAATATTSVYAPTAYSVSIAEAAAATDAPDGEIPAAAGSYPLSAARAGLGSTIIGDTGGKTIVMTDLGAVS